MQFPDDIRGQINNSRRRSLAGSIESTHLEVVMIDGDREEINKNLISWTVTSANSNQMIINLDFEKPVLVSSGFTPDLIVLQVFLS